MARQCTCTTLWCARRGSPKLRPLSTFSDAADALKNISPAIDVGAMGTKGIGSAEWNNALQELSDACSEANVETAIQMFTGG
jgi:hypothetical protein